MNANKISIVITLILIFAITVPLNLLPTNGQATVNNKEKTYPFIGANPNPVQIGQRVLLHYGISYALAGLGNGWTGITITVTKPDTTTETLTCGITDTTGGSSIWYTPTMVGNYTLETNFPEQKMPSTSAGIPINTTMLASKSEKMTLIVQEEPIEAWPGQPLPTEYWSRPINAQLYEWTTIGGDWLEHKAFFASTYAPFNSEAPETAHILWTKPLVAGGLVGGGAGIASPSLQETNVIDYTNFGYETGAAYNDKFLNTIIISGVMYYNQYENRGGNAIDQVVVAVDLHTGKELWNQPLIGRTGNTTGATVPAAGIFIDGISSQFPNGLGRRLSFGQTFLWTSYNLMGAYGLLWTTSGTTWMAFDAFTGRWIYTITDVPSGTTIRGQNGELLRYTINTAQGWMALWNSSALVSMMGGWDPHGNVYNASGVTSPGVLADGPKRAWMWNITIPKGLTGSAQALHLGDRVFGADVGIYAVKSWAFSLKQGQEGTLLYNSTWVPPTSWAESNRTSSVRINAVSLDDAVFTIVNVDSCENWGFSTNTGQLLWGPTEPQPYLDIYQEAMSIIANGRYIVGAESGVIQAYNVTTGSLLWKYEVKDVFNENPVGVNWPLRAPTAIIADGKIYGGYGEHSPNQPLPRGAPFFCLNETTGELIWQQYMVVSSYSYTPAIGDSIVATLNSYDNQIYTIGKGPSTIRVEAPLSSIEIGKSLVIQGSVMDNSPGVKQAGLELRFPNGVPVASDASMSEWMRYVYMQFAKPSTATGVEVSLDVIDSNGNYRNIGTTTTDSSGDFSFAWKPDISGKYTVIATFAGSKSYYPSYDQTAFVVDDAAPTPAPTAEPVQSTADMYFVPAIAGLFVLIIIVLVLVVLIMVKKRP
jgi:outer membrane protein assembly factor BamB